MYEMQKSHCCIVDRHGTTSIQPKVRLALVSDTGDQAFLIDSLVAQSLEVRKGVGHTISTVTSKLDRH